MTAPAVAPEPADIQRLIVYGYGLERSRHFILRVRNAPAARKFLGDLAKKFVTAASDSSGDTQASKSQVKNAVNVGITYRGLEQLGLPKRYLRVLQQKARAFAEGAYLRAARRLGDTGPSAAEAWEKRFKPDFAHVLLSLHADLDQDLNDLTEKLLNLPAAIGLGGWESPYDASHLPGKKARTAHFGFRDGISQPAINGFHDKKDAKKRHEPGEFLLGYENDEGFNTWALPFPRMLPWLLPVEPGDRAEFFRNGSFAAFRKMQQDVAGFNCAVEEWAVQRAGGRDVEKWSEYVKAKLCGRYPDGTLVTELDPWDSKWQAGGNGGLPDEELNNFDFNNDKEGFGCPFGAHIRRMNPREDPVAPFRRRPLLRRGMPYGPEFEADPGAERGLLGLFFCASLEDQFEHLLAEWGNANPMGPDNRGSSKDPFVGNHENREAVFDIPMRDEKLRRSMRDENLRQLNGFAPFVRTRGTLYAFFPSLSTLEMIADIDDKRPS